MSDQMQFFLNNWALLGLPLVTAMIGWFTNFVAIKMLFRPRTPLNFLGFRLIGLIPKRRQEIARKIAEAVERDLISHEDIQRVLQNPEIKEEVKNHMHQHIDILLSKTLGRIPGLSLVYDNLVAKQFKKLAVEHLQKIGPDLIEQLLLKIEKNMDVKTIVEKKIEAFDLAQLEALTYDLARRELRAIELLGGILGFVVGLAQVGILLVTQ